MTPPGLHVGQAPLHLPQLALLHHLHRHAGQRGSVDALPDLAVRPGARAGASPQGGKGQAKLSRAETGETLNRRRVWTTLTGDET